MFFLYKVIIIFTLVLTVVLICIYIYSTFEFTIYNKFFLCFHDKINQMFDIVDLSSFYIHVNLFLVFCNLICILRIVYITNEKEKKNYFSFLQYFFLFSIPNVKKETAQYLTLCFLRSKLLCILKFACYSVLFFFN